MRPSLQTSAFTLTVVAAALAAWVVPAGPSRSSVGGHWKPGSIPVGGAVPEKPDPPARTEREALREAAGAENTGGTPNPPLKGTVPSAVVATGTIHGFARDAGTGCAIPRFGLFECERGSGCVFPSGPSREQRLRWFASSDGSFRRTGLSPGIYGLLFVAEGYVSRAIERVETDGSALEVLLTREAAIRGMVVERGTGTPIGGATVSAVDPESQHWSRFEVDFDARTTTFGDGRFEIRGLGPGSVGLEVRHPGFVDALTHPIDLLPPLDLEGIVISMSRGGAIEGSVVRKDRSPLVDLGVEAYSALGPRDCRVSRTDPGGRFSIQGLRPGPYRVATFDGLKRVSHPTAEVWVEEGRTVRVDLVSPPRGGCTVWGRVLRGGKPIDHAGVHLEPVPRSGPWAWLPPQSWEAETEQDGGFHLENVHPGSATLSVTVGCTDTSIGTYVVTSHFPLVVPQGPELQFDVELTGGEIAGRVVREIDRSPVQGAEIRVFRNEGDEWLWEGTAQTVEDGRYRIQDLAPGAHLLVVWQEGASSEEPPSFAGGCRRSVLLAEGGIARVDFAVRSRGSIVVHLFGPDGLPVSGARVHLCAADHPPPWRFGPRAPETAEPGIYRSDEVSEGRYSIVVCAEGLAATATEEKTIGAAQETACRIDLLPGTLVHVRVVEPGGSTSRFPDVEFTDEKGRSFCGSPTPKGTAVVFTLSPAEYRMTASGAHLERTLRLTVGTSSQEIVVPLIEGVRMW